MCLKYVKLAAILGYPFLTTALSAQTSSSPCPPVTPKNAQEALMMEQSSNKEGCWQRDASGKLVFVNKGGIKYKPVLPQPGPASLAKGIKVRYVAGETGIEILSPWSLRGSGPSWSVAVFKTCEGSPVEYQTTYGNMRKGYKVAGPAETLVSGAQIAEVSPGTHCVLVNAAGFGKSTGWLPKTGQYTSADYTSGEAFRPFDVDVKLGYTAEVSVPMGILTISLSPPSPWGIGCRFKDQDSYDLGIWDTTGQTMAIQPGSYSYSCGGADNEFPAPRAAGRLAAQQDGTVQITSGRASTVTLTPRPPSR